MTADGARIRNFRLKAHHLDKWYGADRVAAVAGACGLQNTPPGAWEVALNARVPGLTRQEMGELLDIKRSLLQAWSYRGCPVVFPTQESEVFLTALMPEQGEPWIYTQGIGLALNRLGMGFDELLPLLVEVLGGLRGQVFASKAALDQALARRMAPLLPPGKGEIWDSPSMYGEAQTVGGAAVSFLLRPCSLMGLIAFGRREGGSPTFAAYRDWVGHEIAGSGGAGQRLVRKYLHCYGPSTPAGLAGWLGCSPAQAQRLWAGVAHELEPVTVGGKLRYILASDRDALAGAAPASRQLHLLGGHDPYLGLQDREIILPDKPKQRLIWQTTSNPGVLLFQGQVAGMWKQRKKGDVLDIQVTLWAAVAQPAVEALCADYARFQGCKLHRLTFISHK